MTKKNVVNAFITSISCSFIAAVINCIFGTILAWTFVKYDFTCKRILDGLIELPFALPTAVTGIALATLYSSKGWFGEYLKYLDLKVHYNESQLIVFNK